MNSGDEIVGVLVVLLVGGERSLFVLLGKDGTINRMGSGSVDQIERQMFIGSVHPDLFTQLRSQVTPGVIHFLGQRLAAPQAKGKLASSRSCSSTPMGTRRRAPGATAPSPRARTQRWVHSSPPRCKRLNRGFNNRRTPPSVMWRPLEESRLPLAVDSSSRRLQLNAGTLSGGRIIRLRAAKLAASNSPRSPNWQAGTVAPAIVLADSRARHGMKFALVEA
jgi:hypothetical protein